MKGFILFSQKVSFCGRDYFYIIGHDEMEYLIPCVLVTKTSRLSRFSAYKIGSRLSSLLYPNFKVYEK